MINTQIDLINYIQNSKAEAKVEKKSSVDKTNEDFSTVLKKANDTKEVHKVEDEISVTKEKPKATELEEKFEELNTAIEEGTDEEVTEVVVEILALLNINVVDKSSIPVVVNLDRLKVEASLDNNLIKNDVIFAQGDIELINNINLDDFSNNTDLSSDDISALIKGLLDSTISEEVINTFDKGINNIIDLVVDNEGSPISKDTLLNNLNAVLNSDKDDLANLDISTNEVEALDENIVFDKESKDFKDSTTLNNDNNNFNDETNENATKESILGKDDKILSKLLDGENNNFSNAISKMEARNSIGKSDFSAPVTVYKTNMNNDVIKNVQFMIKNSVSELKVKIYPKELGEMTIKILSEEGIMKAEIKAVSKETYDLLNSNMNEIKKLLGNEEIKIQDVNIGLYSEDTTYYSGEGYSNESYKEQFTNSNNLKVDSISEEAVENEIDDDCSLDLLV